MIQALTTFARSCDGGLIPTWYKHLKTDSTTCEITDFTFPNDLPPIILAIVEILLRIGVFAAVGFVIYGGFMYMTSQGEPDKAASARKTIVNAVVGLVIGLLATAVVSFIGRQLL